VKFVHTALCSLTLVLALAAPTMATVVPVVRFEAETRAGWDVVATCDAVWRAEGPALARQLLPRAASADTIVCLVLSTASFRHFFGSSLPDWGVGAARPDGHLIAVDYTRLPAVGRGVREVFLHEMVHALLFRGAQGQWLPTWLHEGAAMRYGGEWRFTDTVSLLLDGRVPSLETLQGAFPGAAHRANRAYRTSLLAVNRLEKEYGSDVIPRLVAATARSHSFSTAFTEVTGSTDADFYADFAAAMHLRFGWLVLMTRWPGLFVLLALVLLVGGGRKLLISRRRLREMADDDQAEPPVYHH